MVLPCASLERATTQVWCGPSIVTITSGFAGTGGGVGADGALAPDPQAPSQMQLRVDTKKARAVPCLELLPKFYSNRARLIGHVIFIDRAAEKHIALGISVKNSAPISRVVDV
jgi:hypothetical protein